MWSSDHAELVLGQVPCHTDNICEFSDMNAGFCRNYKPWKEKDGLKQVANLQHQWHMDNFQVAHRAMLIPLVGNLGEASSNAPAVSNLAQTVNAVERRWETMLLAHSSGQTCCTSSHSASIHPASFCCTKHLRHKRPYKHLAEVPGSQLAYVSPSSVATLILSWSKQSGREALLMSLKGSSTLGVDQSYYYYSYY